MGELKPIVSVESADHNGQISVCVEGISERRFRNPFFAGMSQEEWRAQPPHVRAVISTANERVTSDLVAFLAEVGEWIAGQVTR